MDAGARQDLSVLLQACLKPLRNNDAYGLQQLSNQLMERASVSQDEHALSSAVLLYAAAKVVQRGKLRGQALVSLFAEAVRRLKRGDDSGYLASVKQLMASVVRADDRAKHYISTVIEQAQLKRGSLLCSNGVSTARAAEALGVSQWELACYVGKTQMTEDNDGGVTVVERVALVRRLFK